MTDLQEPLGAARAAVDEMLATAAGCAGTWAAPGKWSPAQGVEHVARSCEEAAIDLTGRPSKLPKLPVPLNDYVPFQTIRTRHHRAQIIRR